MCGWVGGSPGHPEYQLLNVDLNKHKFVFRVGNGGAGEGGQL